MKIKSAVLILLFFSGIVLASPKRDTPIIAEITWIATYNETLLSRDMEGDFDVHLSTSLIFMAYYRLSPKNMPLNRKGAK